MCTSLMGSFDGKVPDLEQRMALAVVARSPIDRLVDGRSDARGWSQLPVYSDPIGRLHPRPMSSRRRTRTCRASTVFTRRDGTIRHFWSGEISGEMADPGQDPRGAPDLDPLWTVLDTEPGGPRRDLVSQARVSRDCGGGVARGADGPAAGRPKRLNAGGGRLLLDPPAESPEHRPMTAEGR